MTKEKLIKKSNEFLERNDVVCWRPMEFPEDMSDEDTLSTLESQGNYMYDELKDAKTLIHDLIVELEIK